MRLLICGMIILLNTVFVGCVTKSDADGSQTLLVDPSAKIQRDWDPLWCDIATIPDQSGIGAAMDGVWSNGSDKVLSALSALWKGTRNDGNGTSEALYYIGKKNNSGEIEYCSKNAPSGFEIFYNNMDACTQWTTKDDKGNTVIDTQKCRDCLINLNDTDASSKGLALWQCVSGCPIDSVSCKMTCAKLFACKYAKCGANPNSSPSEYDNYVNANFLYGITPTMTDQNRCSVWYNYMLPDYRSGVNTCILQYGPDGQLAELSNFGTPAATFDQGIECIDNVFGGFAGSGCHYAGNDTLSAYCITDLAMGLACAYGLLAPHSPSSGNQCPVSN